MSNMAASDASLPTAAELERSERMKAELSRIEAAPAGTVARREALRRLHAEALRTQAGNLPLALRDAAREVMQRAEELLKHEDMTCCICMEELPAMNTFASGGKTALPCRHLLHTTCLLKMVAKSARRACPLCSQEFLFEYNGGFVVVKPAA